LAHPFILYSAVIFIIFLGRKAISWDKTWTALLLSIIVGYTLAELFFMRLYIPNRYLRYSMAVLLILWNSRNWGLMLEKIPWRSIRIVCLVVLISVAGYSYRDTFRQGKDTASRSKFRELCSFLRMLPEEILIAGHPRIMDDIPIQARRSVLCNYKLAHPWFTGYYATIRKRTYDTLDAMFCSDLEDINALYDNYGVTHFIVGKKYYKRARDKENVYDGAH